MTDRRSTSGPRRSSLLNRAVRTGLVTGAAGVGYSAMFVDHAMELPPAVSGERREHNGRAGRLSYYVAGQGEPLLLIHSINAAASAYEVRPIFEHMRARYRVYAPDLPGFGFSDRSARDYTVRLYVDAVHEMLRVIEAESGEEPIDALAVSLSSEFLARVAIERPGCFRSLTLVTPTGFSRAYRTLEGDGSREIPGMHAFFTFPLWSQPFYDLLVSKRSVRYFLQRTFGSKDVDEGMVEYDWRTAHQPGAKNAPYAFVSGKLFSRDIRRVYERLALPVWVPHATRGDFKDFSSADWARARPNWTFQPFASGALPHFEYPQDFLASLEGFLAGEALPRRPLPGSVSAGSAPPA
jgi:pimeloyl-ACP methyl ester carboxylesterase